ncbi:sulfite exporter TauE/SafE family protein [Vibrio sp. SCSIO 43136]|uniref:sulfite exporter TauE/SafE family protein n=1 Tax=Vibrio sp. SCSIO 43136 TaxID=2819101 RepID=UPI002075951B|nr:sulfite exporter TauE/SafE family protein [Vibrio sp. SCSIO 43136]USD66652.1 sulfite exporter TauE/SafE family protein [Vibrio sp. SCSIO 43136]
MGLIFVGSFVQSAIGFGLAIVAAPLLFMLSPIYVPAPICLVALFISLLNAFKHKSEVSLGGLKMAVIGRIPGSIIGGAILLYISPDMLSLGLGVFVLIAVAISLLPLRIEPTPNRMCVAGFFSGFMGTSSSIGGPPMALLLQHQEANSLRGNLSAFFVASSLISLIVQLFIGFFTLEHLWAILPLLPAAWLGYFLAGKFVHHFSKQWIRYCALALCLTSGIGAVWQALT